MAHCGWVKMLNHFSIFFLCIFFNGTFLRNRFTLCAPKLLMQSWLLYNSVIYISHNMMTQLFKWCFALAMCYGVNFTACISFRPVCVKMNVRAYFHTRTTNQMHKWNDNLCHLKRPSCRHPYHVFRHTRGKDPPPRHGLTRSWPRNTIRRSIYTNGARHRSSQKTEKLSRFVRKTSGRLVGASWWQFQRLVVAWTCDTTEI